MLPWRTLLLVYNYYLWGEHSCRLKVFDKRYWEQLGLKEKNRTTGQLQRDFNVLYSSPNTRVAKQKEG
jgi:hypothetical protein